MYIGNAYSLKSKSEWHRTVAESKYTGKKYCSKHPTSFWGEGFNKCVTGFRKNENCEEGK